MPLAGRRKLSATQKLDLPFEALGEAEQIAIDQALLDELQAAHEGLTAADIDYLAGDTESPLYRDGVRVDVPVFFRLAALQGDFKRQAIERAGVARGTRPEPPA